MSLILERLREAVSNTDVGSLLIHAIMLGIGIVVGYEMARNFTDLISLVQTVKAWLGKRKTAEQDNAQSEGSESGSQGTSREEARTPQEGHTPGMTGSVSEPPHAPL